MEIKNNGRVSHKTKGFFVLPNGIGGTVPMGQDLQLKMCQPFQKVFEQQNLIVPQSQGCAINLGQVQVEGIQTENAHEVTAQNTMARHQDQ